MTVTEHRVRLWLSQPQALAHTSAVLWRPASDEGGCGLVLGHGAGSTMAHPVIRAVGQGLADRGYPVLAFNFAYAEAGRRRPDPATRLRSAFRDATDLAAEVLGKRPLVLGGRSLGGRIASLLAAEGQPCAGLALLGYPLHPYRSSPPGAVDGAALTQGRPERLRTDHWSAITVPTLFVQGDRDRLCDLDLLAAERQKLAGPSTLHVLAGADHGYKVRKREGRDAASVLAEATEAVTGWVQSLRVGVSR
ncbi:MAG: alpha/beta hydrolase family protein [Egibacteraceae bacterium]